MIDPITHSRRFDNGIDGTGTPTPDGLAAARSVSGMVASVVLFVVAFVGVLLTFAHPALIAAFASGAAGKVALGHLGIQLD